MGERKEVLVGKTKRTRTGCGNIYVTVNFDGDKPIETFVRLGKAGGCASSQTEALGRLISLALKYNVPIMEIVDQLKGIGCHLVAFAGNGQRNLSCADAVANCIDSIYTTNVYKQKSTEKSDEQQQVEIKKSKKSNNPGNLGLCPDCSAPLQFEEGCMKCVICGYTKC